MSGRAPAAWPRRPRRRPRGAGLRHDCGGRLMAEDFRTRLKAWRMTPNHALVGPPDTDGVIERFLRPPKGQVSHGRLFRTLDAVRDAVRAFIARHDAEWPNETDGHLGPRATRRRRPPGDPALGRTIQPSVRGTSSSSSRVGAAPREAPRPSAGLSGSKVVVEVPAASGRDGGSGSPPAPRRGRIWRERWRCPRAPPRCRGSCTTRACRGWERAPCDRHGHPRGRSATLPVRAARPGTRSRWPDLASASRSTRRARARCCCGRGRADAAAVDAPAPRRDRTRGPARPRLRERRRPCDAG